MESISFEQALQRIEEIVKTLESNQSSLEQSVELFQEGIELSKICSNKLETIGTKVAQIATNGTLKDLKIEE